MAFPADHAGSPFRHTSPAPPPRHSAITMEDELSSGEVEVEGEGEGSDRGAWFIPRPALCRDSTTCTSCHSSSADRQASRSIRTVTDWLSPPSTSSTPSSKSSTQSGTSGTLLLTAANLAALRLEHTHGTTDHGAHKALDATSVASSTHFTMVNGMSRGKGRGPPPVDCCRACHKHQLTAVVLTVCGLFLVGLCLAVYYIDVRARGATLS